MLSQKLNLTKKWEVNNVNKLRGQSFKANVCTANNKNKYKQEVYQWNIYTEAAALYEF
jgi:hypothetical protein